MSPARLLLVATLTCAIGSTAFAQSDGEAEVDPAEVEARAHFERGRELAAMRRFSEAAQSFERSLAQFDRPSTRFNLALCYFALGHYVEAEAELDRFLTSADAEADAESIVEARQMLQHARATAGSLTIELEPAQASVQVDGSALTGGRVRELRLNPGTHVLRVSADGHSPVLQEIAVGEGERVRRAIQLEIIRRPSYLSVAVRTPSDVVGSAEVRIDGEAVEQTEEAEVTAGEHQVDVTHPDTLPYGRTVELDEGEHLIVEAILERRPPPPRVPIVRRPAFWAVVGAVVVIGAGVGVGVALSGRVQSPHGGSTGIVLRTDGSGGGVQIE